MVHFCAEEISVLIGKVLELNDWGIAWSDLCIASVWSLNMLSSSELE